MLQFVAGTFFAGLSAGQILNLVANEAGQSSSLGLSACSTCAARAKIRHLIPLVPWLAGAPRCACGAVRPFREPLVAIAAGGLFAVAAVRFGPSTEWIHAALAVLLITTVAVTDAVYWLMPFVITIPGILVGIAASFLTARLGWLGAVGGASLGFGFVFAYELLARHTWAGEPLGGGVKFFAAMVGAFLGPGSVLAMIPLTIVHALLLGLILMLLRGRASVPTEREPAIQEQDEPEVPGRWKPSLEMIQAGPIIAVVAFELLFWSEWLFGVLPEQLGRVLL